MVLMKLISVGVSPNLFRSLLTKTSTDLSYDCHVIPRKFSTMYSLFKILPGFSANNNNASYSVVEKFNMVPFNVTSCFNLSIYKFSYSIKSTNDVGEEVLLKIE